MSSRKSRSKDDTWTTEELGRALKTTKTDEEKRYRSSTDKNRRKGDDDRRHRNHDADDERRTNKEDDERERQRIERRERREKKDKLKHKDEKVSSSSRVRDRDDKIIREERRERKEREVTRDRENKHLDRDDERRERRERKEKVRSKDDKYDRDSEKRDRREKVKDDKYDRDDDKRHRRDKSKRREERHGEKEGRSIYEEERNDKKKHSSKSREKDDDHRKDRHRRDKENRDRENRDERRSKREVNGNSRHREEEKIMTENTKNEDNDDEEEEDYNYDDDDFENYDDDFEEEDDDEEVSDVPVRQNSKDREMNDILRALNEENAALTPGSAGSRQSNSSERSEEPSYIPKPARQKTFINFVSAKQRAVDQKVSSKTRKRYKDLMSLIEFDKAEFVIFDLPPVKEYDLYIRSFGRSDAKQAYVQTNDDDVDRDVQTEEIEFREKWTQHPAEDVFGCGGDDENESLTAIKSEYTSKHQTEKIAQFVSKAAQVVCILLDEESGQSSSAGFTGKKSDLSVSAGYVVLGTPAFLQGRHVLFATFSPGQPNILLTLFSQSSNAERNSTYDNKGLLCVWNVLEASTPQKLLACESQPRCCCFSPRKPLLAFAGMEDGSVVVWDLREEPSMHQRVTILEEQFTFRYPTYNTAGVLDNENHFSPVSSLLPVYPDQTCDKYNDGNMDDMSGLSFQLASCDEDGSVNLWVVAEIPTPDLAGSEIDLGLQPGGRIKLVKSSSFKLKIPDQMENLERTRAFEFQFSPSDLNQYYVGTDVGVVIHGVRLGSCGFPRKHSTMIDKPIDMRTIDLSPFGDPYILAGCSDGFVYLYHTCGENPLIKWGDLGNRNDNSIVSVRWSRSRPGVFFVLDNLSMLHTFDLLEGDSRPVQSEQLSTGVVTTIALGNDTKIVSPGSFERPPQLLIAFDNGETQVHNIKEHLSQQQTLEHEFLTKYNERF